MQEQRKEKNVEMQKLVRSVSKKQPEGRGQHERECICVSRNTVHRSTSVVPYYATGQLFGRVVIPPWEQEKTKKTNKHINTHSLKLRKC